LLEISPYERLDRWDSIDELSRIKFAAVIEHWLA